MSDANGAIDVVIVGGGPAGTSTALHLVRAERMDPARIVLVDKARFPRDKPCAGAISRFGLDVLSSLGVRVSVPAVALAGVRLLAEGRVGETRDAMGIAVRRTEFDASLVDEVRADGVRVVEGEALQAIARTDRGFTLTLASGTTLSTRHVAACDGAGSTTRKLLGLREPARKGHLYVLETEALPGDTGVRRGLADFDLAVLEDGLQGYYWDFPAVMDGVPCVSRGIYHANLTPASPKAALARALARRGIDLAATKPRPFSTRPYVPGSTAWAPGVVLVGEACGIDRTTGEGIAQAIDMGRLAARHLARGGPRFDAYDAAVRTSTSGRHMLQSAWLAEHVYRRRLGRPARRFLVRSAFARAAALRWYGGESLGRRTHARLGLGLLFSL